MCCIIKLNFIRKRKYKFGKKCEIPIHYSKVAKNVSNELKFGLDKFENTPKIFWNFKQLSNTLYINELFKIPEDFW